MSIFVRYTGAPSLTKLKYDETIRRLTEEGLMPAEELEYHIASGPDGHFSVSEIWDSREKLEAFTSRLMPILAASGVELAGPPEIVDVHKIIKR